MGTLNWHNLEFGYLLKQFSLYLSHLRTNPTVSSSYSFLFSPTFLVLIGGVVTFLLLLRWLYLFRKSLIESSVLLELTPPAFTNKSAYTTGELFSVIHGLGKYKKLSDRLLGIKPKISFEIVSTQNQGIRYLVRTTPQYATNIKRYILSYLPQVKIKEIDDYLLEGFEKTKDYHRKVIEFKLNRHFAYPLKKQDILAEHDPVAYITGMMTKLAPSELISFQIVLSPTKVNESSLIKRMVLRNENVLAYLDSFHPPSFLKPITLIFKILSKLIYKVGSELQWAITELMHPNTQPVYAHQNYAYQQMQIQQQIKPARTLTSFEEATIQSVQEKIDKPLFEATMRLMVIVKDKEEERERIGGFISSLETFSVPGYQSLIKINLLSDLLLRKVRTVSFKKRLLSFLTNSGSSILSASEIADLYHFPISEITKTEDLIKTYSKDLPTPLSLKNNKLDFVFAKNTFGGTTTDIGLTEKEREKHIYLIGATGTGKTTMILSMVNQDINNGKGICVIDPHGDLAESASACIPLERKADFIYFNPDDIKYPIGLNLLELTRGLDEEALLREKELITEGVVSLFRKIFSEVWSAHAHRLEYILRNTIQTALCLQDPTIFTVYDLLTDPEFREKALPQIEDKNLKNFWKYEFARAGDYQKVKMIGPITSRIGRFLFSPSAKRIFEQTRSTINFDEILNKGKILICNLSKGKISEDTAEVMGIMILTKIQLAALKRARIPEKDRKPFYVYVDEFQTFATPSFMQMLSEARKYKVFLTMAEQSTSQQKDRNITNVIIANVGTVGSFKSANPDDERLMLAQFSPYIEKGEIANLPAYKFYMKISAMIPQEPFSGETIVTKINPDKKMTDELIQSSRNLYATLYVAPKPAKSKEIPQKQDKNEVSAESIGVLT